MAAAVDQRVVIIGGGISGLGAAHYLAERSQADRYPLEVLLLEAAPRLGGVIRTEQRDGCLLEAGPDSFLTDKPWGLQLCDQLGLTQELIPTNPECRRSFVVRRDRLLPVPDGFSLLAPTNIWSLLASPVLSPWGKCRALGEWVIPRGHHHDDESVAAFVRRRFGREVFEYLAEPMVRGVASGDPATLSMRALFPQFVEMEQQYGSVIRGLRARTRAQSAARRQSTGPRYGLFMSFRGGMQTLIDRLAQHLPAQAIRRQTPVAGLEPGSQRQRWGVRLGDGSLIEADAVCVAVPSFQAAALLRGVDAALAQELNQISYASWLTMYLAYRRADVAHPLDGFGFVVPATERHPITGCTFTHVKFPGRAPDGTALLRAFVRYDDHPAAVSVSDAEWRGLISRALARWLGIARAPLWTMLFRCPRALPQYHVGHPARLQTIRQRLEQWPALSVVGNSYEGHGVTNCLGHATPAAAGLYDALRRRATPHDPLHAGMPASRGGVL